MKESGSSVILRNGLIYTVDKERSHAEALVAAGGKIRFTGSSEEAESYMGPGTQVIDLEGKMVLPGFVDAHAHPSQAMDFTSNISLYQLDSPEAYLEEIRSYIHMNPERDYYRGSGWSDNYFPHRGPRKAVLDEIAPDRPVVLVSYDGHSLWVNSDALSRAGISKDTPDTPGGAIVRDQETGEPSGALRETAMKLVEEVIPDYTLTERMEALLAYQDMALKCGITMCHDAMLETASIEAYRALDKEGLLKMRFCGALLVEPDREIEEQLKYVLEERNRNQSSRFWINAAKIFVDGVIEGATGFLLEPYEQRPDYYGLRIWNTEKLKEAAEDLDTEGVQLHFHAIGDGALRLALDVLEHAQAKNGKRDSRHLITHIQLAAEEDIQRFEELGVVGVPQPFWFSKGQYYKELALPYLGQERADRQYPMNSFFKRGIPMASSSDFPVTIPFDPLIGIQTGIARCEPGEGPDEALWAEEAVSLEEMIDSFTIKGALANFMETRIGSLEVGKQADLIVLDGNLLETAVSEIAQVNVLLTMVSGKIVYKSKDFDW